MVVFRVTSFLILLSATCYCGQASTEELKSSLSIAEVDETRNFEKGSLRSYDQTEAVEDDSLSKSHFVENPLFKRLFGSSYGSTSSRGGLTSDEKQQLLDYHNYGRQLVSPTATDMTLMRWDTRLEQTAQNYANRCIFGHNSRRSSQTSGYSYVGENIYLTTGTFAPYNAVAGWFNERDDYDYNTNTCRPRRMCGHYTQIVWATSNYVGCGLGNCGSRKILVCNYGPGGNIVGRRPYVAGRPCTNCPAGTRFCYNYRLCQF